LAGDPTLEVFVARSENDGLEPMIGSLASLDGIRLVGTATSGTEIAAVLRTDAPDAIVFPVDRADLARTIRVSARVPMESPPFFVAASARITRPLIVKAALSGFHGLVETGTAPATLGARMGAIVTGRVRLDNEPILRDLGLPPGLLARGLEVEPGDDTDIADLVGAGLPDADIAVTMGASVQTVRNRIEHILHANGLSHRTQLAVVRASLVKVPDFS
jgi:DNA-binding NarL/FixJ family response regulator